MLSDTALVAIIGSAATFLVAAVSSLAAIFGPYWTGERARREERRQRADDLRYERALAFIDALGQMGSRVAENESSYQPVRNAYIARNRFVAVLRHGEGAAAKFCADAVTYVHDMPAERRTDRLERVNVVSDALFGWLRGELPIGSLTLPPQP